MIGKRSVALSVAVVLAGALPSAAAQVFHWVDNEGIVHYTTGLESVPERYRAAARPLAVSPVEASPPGLAAVPARTGIATVPFVVGTPIVVQARINGAGPIALVLDTGADRTMVAPAALARLGIGVPGTYRAEVRGVTGAARADVLWIESLDVAGAWAGPLPIVAHDADIPLADGLLGRDFLSLFSVTIDTRTGTVRLEPN
jgi:Aspartyl protease/Domain of unknown function (DUF4124)